MWTHLGLCQHTVNLIKRANIMLHANAGVVVAMLPYKGVCKAYKGVGKAYTGALKGGVQSLQGGPARECAKPTRGCAKPTRGPYKGVCTAYLVLRPLRGQQWGFLMGGNCSDRHSYSLLGQSLSWPAVQASQLLCFCMLRPHLCCW
jgi:hypothetical protein